MLNLLLYGRVAALIDGCLANLYTPCVTSSAAAGLAAIPGLEDHFCAGNPMPTLSGTLPGFAGECPNQSSTLRALTRRTRLLYSALFVEYSFAASTFAGLCESSHRVRSATWL